MSDTAGRVFGEAFTRALYEGSKLLEPYLPYFVQPAFWVLLSLNYESAGMNHLIVNSHGYSGLPQFPRYAGTLYIDRPGKRDPAVQVRDAIRNWLTQIHSFKYESIDSLDEFYCLNLAPARVCHDVIYAHPRAPFKPETPETIDAIREAQAAAKKYGFTTAYEAQDKKFDPERRGFIAKEMLSVPVMDAYRVNQKRVDREFALVMALAEKEGV